jgi:hypothetical protein
MQLAICYSRLGHDRVDRDMTELSMTDAGVANHPHEPEHHPHELKRLLAEEHHVGLEGLWRLPGSDCGYPIAIRDRS